MTDTLCHCTECQIAKLNMRLLKENAKLRQMIERLKRRLAKKK